jgi:hypothetical protein
MAQLQSDLHSSSASRSAIELILKGLPLGMVSLRNYEATEPLDLREGQAGFQLGAF